MIDITAVENKIRNKYQDLEWIADGIFRAIDHHADRAYAVRYFDLTDQLISTAAALREYQEGILSERYFSAQTPTDLRWNYYVYFVTSTATSHSADFRWAKFTVEADREYARKMVLSEEEIDVLKARDRKVSQSVVGMLIP